MRFKTVSLLAAVIAVSLYIGANLYRSEESAIPDLAREPATRGPGVRLQDDPGPRVDDEREDQAILTRDASETETPARDEPLNAQAPRQPEHPEIDGPEVPTTTASVQALPGIQGFELSVERPPSSMARALAAEEDDPAWSSVMEARLLGEISQLAGLGLVGLYVECRTSICGLLFVLPEPEHRAFVYDSFFAVADELGFQGRMIFSSLSVDGTPFTSIYLQQDRTSTVQANAHEAPSA